MKIGNRLSVFMVSTLTCAVLMGVGVTNASPSIRAGGLVSYPIPVISGNLLINPGFEILDPNTQLPTGWVASKAFSSSPTTSKTGNKSLVMKDAPLYPYSESIRQTIFLKKGSYRFSGWVKLDNLGDANKGVRISLAGQGSTPIVHGTSDWQKLSAEKVYVASDGYYKFSLEAYSEPTGTVWFDDVELQRESQPVESFLLYPNYRGMLFDDQSQRIDLDVSVEPPEGTSLQDYVVENSLVNEVSGSAITVVTHLAETHFSQSLDGSYLENDNTYLLRTRLLRITDNTIVYEYPAYRISKLSGVHRDSMTVSFDEKNRFLSYGKPTFWLGVYDSGMGYPATDVSWENQLITARRLFELPINLYNNYWYGTITLSSVQLLMNVLQRHGINYLQTGNAFSGTYDSNYFAIDTNDAFLSTISGHPALAGFYTVDEANASLAPTMFAQYNRLRNFKPDGVTFGTLLSPNNIAYWRDTVDVLSMDPYPLYGIEPVGGYPLNRVGDYTLATREAVKGSRPFMTVLQFFKGSSNSRWPTRDELKNMSYMAIAEGSNGLLFWSLGARALSDVCSGWCSEKVDHFEDLKSVMHELKGLEPALTSVDQPTLLTSNSNPVDIRTRIKFANGVGYLIAYNHTNMATSATFTWAHSPDTVSVYNENRQLDSGADSFTDTFAPYQAHVYLITDSTPPTASFVSQLNGTVIQGTTSITVVAEDNVGVTRVDLYANGQIVNSITTASASEYIFSWDTTAVANGSYNLSAKVYDAAGNVGQSEVATVIVNNDSIPPTVRITSPGASATITGTTTVNVAAADNIVVSRVELFINGKLSGTKTVAPYNFSWASSSYPVGSNTLVAYAYDSAGNKATSAAVQVTVKDSVQPAVAVTTPLNNSTVRSSTTIAASATDNVGVVKMSVYIDGSLRFTTSYNSLSWVWNLSSVIRGKHTILVRAYDAVGNMGNKTITIYK